jgi:hypothetical protein
MPDGPARGRLDARGLDAEPCIIMPLYFIPSVGSMLGVCLAPRSRTTLQRSLDALFCSRGDAETQMRGGVIPLWCYHARLDPIPHDIPGHPILH